MSETNEKIEVELEDEEKDFVVEEPGEGADPKNLDDELDQYSEGVKARIAKEVQEKHQLKRELEETKQQLGVAANIARRAVDEVKSLRTRVGDGDKVLLDTMVANLSADLELAKAEFSKAHEEGDAKKIADAAAKVSAVASDLRRVEMAKAGYRPEIQPPVQPGPEPAAAPQRPQIHPKAQAWIAKNSEWFGKDPERTRFAKAADAFVAQLGYSPDTDAYYKEVDKMIEERFPRATPEGQKRDPRPSASAVTPVGRSSPPSATARKVPLSSSEQAIARKLGLTNEQYAQAKLSGTVVI
jgi:hypothetical protein